MLKSSQRYMEKDVGTWYDHVGCKSDDMLLKSLVVMETRKRGRFQKRWTDTISKLFRAICISNEGTSGKIFDLVYWRHVMY